MKNKKLITICIIIIVFIFISSITIAKKVDFIPVHKIDINQSEMIKIRGSYFLMGNNDGFKNEYPQHKVYVKSFALDKYEVSNFQYCQFLNKITDKMEIINSYIHLEHPSSLIILENGRYKVLDKYKNHPVVNVTWYGAKAYAEFIGKRLPTEAEWEFVASNRGQSLYAFGNSWDTDNCNHSSFDIRPFTELVAPLQDNRGTLPRGTLPKELMGTYDLAGNVMEWTEDTYYPNFVHHDLYAKNPKNITDSIDKSVRGGGWFYLRNNNYTAYARTGFSADFYADYIGFRCAKSLE